MGGIWPGKAVWVWVVPDESKEGALKELIRVFDGSSQKSVTHIIRNT